MASRRKTRDEDEAPLVPPPEQTLDLAGHDAAEAELLAAIAAGRLHHAWLITGQKGVGKATLAFRLARFLLRYGRDDTALRRATSLAVPGGDPIVRQVAAIAAQDLLVLRRPRDEKTGVEKTVIPVDEVRRLAPFFGLASGAGGYRVAIIDTVDELNRNSSNALLKSLEEPPQRAVLLLIAHAPGRALATIRSRCRTLHLNPLTPDDLASKLGELGARHGLPALLQTDQERLSALAGGRVGRALELWASGGLGLSKIVDDALAHWPDLSPQRTAALLESTRASYDTASDLLVAALHEAARSAALGQQPASGAGVKCLAGGARPDALAELAGELEEFFAKGEGINLDERAMVGEALRRIASVPRVSA